MSSTPSMTTPPAPTCPEPTEAEHEAMFASVVWFENQRSIGALEKYEGMHVAILGEQILDADSNMQELVRRLDARGDALPQNGVVLQYVYRLEDLI